MIDDYKDKHRNKPNSMGNTKIKVFFLFHFDGYRCFKQL